MNIYLLERSGRDHYDDMSAQVVVAESEGSAKELWGGSECTLPVSAKLIGTASVEFAQPEVICSDFYEA